MVNQPDNTLSGEKPSFAGKIARALGSPIGVLITMPLIVVGAGLAILLVGRNATRESSEDLARKQLHEQAVQVDREVEFALDQCAPILESLRGIANDGPISHVGLHLYELVLGRAGVQWVSISYPNGVYQAAKRIKKPDGKDTYEVHDSRVEPDGATTRYTIYWGGLRPIAENEPSKYDPRNRDFYQAAVDQKQRLWTRPYTFYKTHETGVTCSEPMYSGTKALRAVLTVDFDVYGLSAYIGRAPVEGARTYVFTTDGTVLAFPAGKEGKVTLPAKEGSPLHIDDLHEPSLSTLYAELRKRPEVTEFTYLDVDGPDGKYLASVAPIGGKRAGVETPLKWTVATLVPEDTLLGPARALSSRSVRVSAAALAVAVALAIFLALNLVRMRKAVATARARAVEADLRAKELGSWRLTERLGAGGMGEVWRAEHRLLVRQAAIKLMRADPNENERDAAETRERFRREANALAAMRSRHTIEIFDYGVTEDHAFYYVMELLDGIDLDTLAIRFGPQPPARVIQLLTQACASLAEAHDAGLLHRDVKPANIFICRAADEVDVVKLLDFGIVHVVGSAPAPMPVRPAAPPAASDDSAERMTEIGLVLGTPGFMSPEQARGLPLDARADLYGLGCVAWMLLTGTEVFERTSHQALMFNHIVEPVPSLARRVRGWIPPGLVDAVTACLAKDAKDRPPSARVLGSNLRSIAIPDDHAWTMAKAQEWWQDNVPRPAATPRDATGRLMVPAHTDPLTAGRAPAAPTARDDAATVRGSAIATNSPPTLPGLPRLP